MSFGILSVEYFQTTVVVEVLLSAECGKVLSSVECFYRYSVEVSVNASSNSVIVIRYYGQNVVISAPHSGDYGLVDPDVIKMVLTKCSS